MWALLEYLDHRVFFIVNQGMSTPLLDHLLWWVSVLANGGVLILVVGIGLRCFDRQALRCHYGWLIMAVLTGGMVVQLLKYGIARPRPLAEFAPLLETGQVHIHVIGRTLRHRSFPSGHTQAVASVCVYLTCVYPRRWVAWAIGLCLVGLSRVYLGVHFPTDVLAGALLGSLTAVAAWYLQRVRRAECGVRRESG